MLQWVLCKVGWHKGLWVSDSGIPKCARIRICRGCGEKSSLFQHVVLRWESDGYFKITESGACIHCEAFVTRDKPRLPTGGSEP